MKSNGLLALLLLVVWARMAGATTYVMMPDEVLADQAPVIAVVAVADAGPAPDAAATEYLVEVQRVLKGHMPGSAAVVRVPGGTAPDGTLLEVWGAPAFAAGDRAILFLAPAADGSYGILHLMLGAFRAAGAAGRLAMRDLSAARQVGPDDTPEVPRSFERFADWLADRAAGRERPRDYFEPAAKLRVESPYTLNPLADGRPVRWFRFDGGGGIAWRMHAAGQPGLGLEATAARLREALAAWTDDPTSDILYTYGGTATAAGGLAGSDGVNGVLFDDPGNRHVPGSFKCSGGGVVAIGAAYAYASTRAFRGEAFHEIFEADVITNDGTECFFRDNPGGAAEVFAHEFGHTLGFGHSAEREALMWSKAHDDGRGARLHYDDRCAAAALYGDGAPPPPPPPPPAATVPAAPSELTASVSGSSLELTWEDNSEDETEFRIERKFGKKFREVLTLPAGTANARLDELAAGATYVLRIRAKNDVGFSPYSNTVSVKIPGRSRR